MTAKDLIERISHELDAGYRQSPQTLQSSIERMEEDPPSAAWHLILAGKEYMLILQPTDLPSR